MEWPEPKSAAAVSAATVLLLLAFGAAAAQAGPGAKLDLLVLTGKGVAVNTADRADVHLVKVGVGRVLVPQGNATVAVKAGVLFFDDARYRLTAVAVDNGSTVNGTVQLNGTAVGSLSATAKIRGDHEIWVGTLSLNGKAYDLYVVSATRGFHREEVSATFVKFCASTGGEECRERAAEFCEDHPDDAVCEKALAKFWMKHTDDIRGRAWLVRWCDEHPSDCSVQLNLTGAAAASILPPKLVGKLISTEIREHGSSMLAVRTSEGHELKAESKEEAEVAGSGPSSSAGSSSDLGQIAVRIEPKLRHGLEGP